MKLFKTTSLSLIAVLLLIFSEKSNGQTNQETNLIWITSPLSKVYQNQKVRINTFFKQENGEAANLENITYEVNKGIVKTLNQGKILELQVTEPGEVILKAKRKEQVIGVSKIRVKKKPEIYLADQFGNPLDHMSFVVPQDYLQVLVADNEDETYQVKKLIARVFRKGIGGSKKESEGHILDCRGLDLADGDGVQLKVELVENNKPIRLKLISFFVKER